MRWKFTPTEEEKDFIMKKFHNNLVIPKNFAQTALPYNTIDSSNQHDLGEPIINPQTVEFCKKLCRYFGRMIQLSGFYL